MSSRFLLLCLASGCVWGAIGYWLGHHWMSPFIWGAVVASPLIGVCVGLAYRPACGASLTRRILLSLATLYAAAILFGFAAGVSDVLRFIPTGSNGRFRNIPEVIFQGVVGTLWGLTFTGYFLVLWPLSFINHALVCHFYQPPNKPMQRTRDKIGRCG